MTSDQLSLFGLFLGLASLLGSLFAIHLSTWLRDLMALRMKAKKNHRGNDDASKQAMRECQYASDGLINSVPIVMTAVMTAFLGIIGWRMLTPISDAWDTSSIARDLAIVTIAFGILYILLTIWILCRGFRLACEIRRLINKHINGQQ